MASAPAAPIASFRLRVIRGSPFVMAASQESVLRLRAAYDACKDPARAMATIADLDTLALAMPEATKDVSEDGRPTYLVHGKFFCFHRTQRPDAVDPESGERLDDVLVFRVEDLDVKELLLSDARGVYFTTPHWKGYAAVLMRIPDLKKISK